MRIPRPSAALVVSVLATWVIGILSRGTDAWTLGGCGSSQGFSFNPVGVCSLRMRRIYTCPKGLGVVRGAVSRNSRDGGDSDGENGQKGISSLPRHVRDALSTLSEEERTEILRSVGLAAKKGPKTGRMQKPRESSASRRARRKASEQRKAAEAAQDGPKKVEMSAEEKGKKIQKGWEAILNAPKSGEDEVEDEERQWENFEAEDGDVMVSSRDQAFFSETALPQDAGESSIPPSHTLLNSHSPCTGLNA